MLVHTANPSTLGDRGKHGISGFYEFEDSLVYPPRESSKPARLHRDLVSKKQKEEVAGVPHSGQSAGYL